MPWWLWLAQGSLVLIVGTLFALQRLLKINVYILSTVEFSWLPICAMIILVLGFFDLIDAIFAKEVCDFMQRMNAGILDLVFGVLLSFGISDMLISALFLPQINWHMGLSVERKFVLEYFEGDNYYREPEKGNIISI